jgi:hypothetical protein
MVKRTRKARTARAKRGASAKRRVKTAAKRKAMAGTAKGGRAARKKRAMGARKAGAGRMGASSARTVDEYLAELPTDRRPIVATVRDVVLRSLPPGYEEAMNFGVICYQVPLARYPNTYNDQPLCYAALAAQKHHYALYLMGGYGDDQQKTLRIEFERAGKKLDMGKSCVRFRTLDDLPLQVIGDFVASIPPEKYIEKYEASRRGR